MRIIKPTKKYFDEYLAACKESIDNNVTEWLPLQEDEFDSWKDSALRRYKRLETGEGLPLGIPRMVTYWCIEDDRFIGEIQIRPYLTQEVAKDMGHIGYAVRHSCWGKGYGTQILKKSVKKLQALNVTPIYLACHIDNIGSNKVSQKVGFEFVEERINSEGDKENLYVLKH